MDEPNFIRSGVTRLLWSAETGLKRQLLFHATVADIPPQMKLSQTWADSAGVYVMFGSSLPDDGNDSQRQLALETFLAWRGWPALGTRVLWIDTGTDAVGIQPFAWSAVGIDCIGTSAFTLRRSVDIAIQGYFVSCGAGAALSLTGDSTGLQMSGTTTLMAPGGAYAADRGIVTIPMGGVNAASWLFDLTLTQGQGSPGGSDFEKLGIGLRYCAPAEDDSVSVLHLPVLHQPSGSLPLHALIDPLHLLDPARTRLSLFPTPGASAAAATLAGVVSAMQSNFVTARGHQVNLTPSDAGPRPAGFVFGLQPLLSGAPGTVPTCCYLTLDGDFQIDVVAPPGVAAVTPIERLVCGISGLEYLGIPDGANFHMVFMPGNAAFAAGAAEEGALPLSASGTTAWVYLSTGNVLGRYYSQPDRAPLYSSPAQGFLGYLELPSAMLPAFDGQHAFPMAPYLGLAPELASLARTLENQSIAPCRQAVIASLVATPKLAAADSAETLAVTPQGLAVGLDESDPLAWHWLGIANQQGSSEGPDLRFTQVTGLFKQAMQANRLFMVMTDANLLMGPIPRAPDFIPPGSIACCLSAQAIAQVRADPPPGLTPAMLDAIAAALSDVVKSTENDFLAALLTAVPGLSATLQSYFLRLAGLLVAQIGQWRFQISPRNWAGADGASGHDAIFIVKLTAERTLADCAQDPGSWAWPEVARTDGRIETTVTRLARILSDAQAAYDADPTPANPYAHFVTTVMNDRNWCGFLVLQCDVPLSSLPEALRPLQIGIDPSRFFAHHWGVDVTGFSVSGTALSFERSSMFALIDYDDPADLLLDSSIEFGFKVLKLSAGFRNSMVSSFSSRIELMVNRLFGAPTRLYPTDHGNNLIFNGSYQQQLGADGLLHATYLFSTENAATYQVQASALRSVEVLAAQLATNPSGANEVISGTFQISGNLRFWQNRAFDPFCYGVTEPPPVPPPAALIELEPEIVMTPHGPAQLIRGSEIAPGETQASRRAAQARDAASEAAPEPGPQPLQGEDGYLRFSDLRISMSFDPVTKVPTFGFDTDHIAFDLSRSVPRADSLANRFPVTVRRLIAAPDLPGDAGDDAGFDPGNFGYVSVNAAGFEQSTLARPWYGLEYELNLGTLGALAASAGLVVTVLAAWSAGGTDDAPAVYFGVKMPGMKDALGVDLPLQGVLKLGFRTIEFDTYPAPGTDAGLAYLMRLRNFGLHVLGLSFPPGRNDILLFGNPDQAGATTLGWYAAYAAETDKKKKSPQPRSMPRLLATRLRAKPSDR